MRRSTRSVYDLEGRIAIGPNGCWEWLRAIKKASGHGMVFFRGSMKHAHRVVWTLVRGEIPAGAIVMHKCDNAKCVNPTHLELGTHEKNLHDMRRRGRGASVLKPEQVREILRSKEKLVVLARRYKVHRSSIWRIRTGRNWAELVQGEGT